MIQIDRRIFIHFDYTLPILLIPLVSMSYFLIHELYPILADKQLIYFLTGLVVFFIFFIMPIRKLLWFIPVFYWLNVTLLLSVKFFGVTLLGAKRWLEIPFVHITIQPSELTKISFIMMMAYLIYKSPPPEKGYNFFQFLKFSIYILIPFVLILIQPDLGTALILLFVGYGILFIVGVNYKIWLFILAFFVAFAPLVYNHLEDYQKKMQYNQKIYRNQ